jgi:hypothetical protein
MAELDELMPDYGEFIPENRPFTPRNTRLSPDTLAAGDFSLFPPSPYNVQPCSVCGNPAGEADKPFGGQKIHIACLRSLRSRWKASMERLPVPDQDALVAWAIEMLRNMANDARVTFLDLQEQRTERSMAQGEDDPDVRKEQIRQYHYWRAAGWVADVLEGKA